MDNPTFSNLITPPDFVENSLPTVLLIDPEWTEVEDVASFLKTSPCPFNVYIYRPEMRDNAWLTTAIGKAHTIIVNTVVNENSTIKDKVAELPANYYYGPKNFIENKNQINSPVEYLTQFTKEKHQ